VDGDKILVIHKRNLLGKAAWVVPSSGKSKPINGIIFAQGPECPWWVMQKDGRVQCISQGDLILGENNP